MESYMKKNLAPFEDNLQDITGDLKIRYDAEGRPINDFIPPIPPMPSFNEDANSGYYVDKNGEILRYGTEEKGHSK